VDAHTSSAMSSGELTCPCTHTIAPIRHGVRSCSMRCSAKAITYNSACRRGVLAAVVEYSATSSTQIYRIHRTASEHHGRNHLVVRRGEHVPKRDNTHNHHLHLSTRSAVSTQSKEILGEDQLRERCTKKAVSECGSVRIKRRDSLTSKAHCDFALKGVQMRAALSS
jgi:hypothetical protein